jgi:predicted GIY-YIG superfamily endonuclease
MGFAEDSSLMAGQGAREARRVGVTSSMSEGRFFVYIIRCSDGSPYIGHSLNIEERVRAHNDGRGSSWTAGRRPVELDYQERCDTEQQAVVRELQFKRWTHNKKLSLINGDLARLKALSKRRSR